MSANRPAILRTFGIVLALWVAAVAQPVLGGFAEEPAFFIALDASRLQIALFVLIVALAVPLIWLGLMLLAALLLGDRHPDAMRRLRIYSTLPFAALLVAVTAGIYADGRAWLAIPLIALGLGLALLIIRYDQRLALWAWITAPLILALTVINFYVLAPTSSVAAPGFLAATATADSSATDGAATPIVWITLDEWNLPLLLDEDGMVDEQRYPVLANLAGQSTWWRNARSFQHFTPVAIPTMLASLETRRGAPLAADYPDNAFSILEGAGYSVRSGEQMTRLAGDRLIDATDRTGAGKVAEMTTTALAFLVDVLPSDAAVRIAARGSLPVDDEYRERFLDDPLLELDTIGLHPDLQADYAREWTARVGDGDTAATFNFIHLLLPHRPWEANALGEKTQPYATWRWNPWQPASPTWETQYRRSLYIEQARFTDAVLGEVFAGLKAEGLWDDAYVIVTADHGYAFDLFTDGRKPIPRDWPNSALLNSALFRVPLFVKEPGQTTGRIDDVPVFTIDILPTLLADLGIETDAALEGLPFGQRTTAATSRPREAEPHLIDTTLETLERERDQLLNRLTRTPEAPNDHLRVRPFGELLGSEIPLDQIPATAEAVPLRGIDEEGRIPRRGVTPVAVEVIVPSDRAPLDGHVAVVAGGRIVGFLGGAECGETGCEIYGLADMGLATPDAEVGLVLLGGTVQQPTFERIELTPGRA